MSRALVRTIPEIVTRAAAPRTYKAFQQCITVDDGWVMLEHLLKKCAPHLGGHASDLQKDIYDLKVLPGEELDSFLNREATLEKNILLSKQPVVPNLLFEHVIIQLMSCEGMPPFLGNKYSHFLHFQQAHGRGTVYQEDTLDSIYDFLETAKAPTKLIPDSLSSSTASLPLPFDWSIHHASNLLSRHRTPPRQLIHSLPFDSTTRGLEEAWTALALQQINMDPVIAALTQKYCNACECHGQPLMMNASNVAFLFFHPVCVNKSCNTT